MRRIWEALILRIISWLTPNIPEDLDDDMCQCDHERCAHDKGRYKCHVEYPPDREWTSGAKCVCKFFVRRSKGKETIQPKTPSDKELEELYKK